MNIETIEKNGTLETKAIANIEDSSPEVLRSAAKLTGQLTELITIYQSAKVLYGYDKSLNNLLEER